MTPQQSAEIYEAISILADTALTLSGPERDQLVPVMQTLADMETGEAGSWKIEQWLAEYAAV